MEQHPVALWRTVHGLSRTGLAGEIGISQPSLLEIEGGSTQPRADTVRALVAATERLRPGRGLSAGQILGTEPYDPAPVDEADDAPEPAPCARPGCAPAGPSPPSAAAEEAA